MRLGTSLWDEVARGRWRSGESGLGVLAACVRTEVLSFSLSAMGVVFSGCAEGERKGELVGVFVGVLSSLPTSDGVVLVSLELDSGEYGGFLLASSGLETLEKSVSSM